jgi:hypothetical protein
LSAHLQSLSYSLVKLWVSRLRAGRLQPLTFHAFIIRMKSILKDLANNNSQNTNVKMITSCIERHVTKFALPRCRTGSLISAVLDPSHDETLRRIEHSRVVAVLERGPEGASENGT